MSKPIRVLIAKPGLDGHDRGAKVVALALRDAGFEVIYTGLHQTVDQIVEAAMQEDVAAIGLSILSGAHLPITERLISKLDEVGFRPLLLVGGNIPQSDQEPLRRVGVDGVFPTGSNLKEISDFIRQQVESRRAG
ncbi:MAG: cobalamin B12-binding domain-containing protein [Anaerolineales bacterium]|jgi:methylmalonyl-CoA mutase C-terminal domain/subunit